MHGIGWEAAINAMDSIFKDQNSDAALLIDAENAFNLVNREAFIHNVEIVCPLFLLHLIQIAIPVHLDCLLLESY